MIDWMSLWNSLDIACLDYSVARPGGNLVAYRWDGETTLDAERFVLVGRLEQG